MTVLDIPGILVLYHRPLAKDASTVTEHVDAFRRGEIAAVLVPLDHLALGGAGDRDHRRWGGGRFLAAVASWRTGEEQ